MNCINIIIIFIILCPFLCVCVCIYILCLYWAIHVNFFMSLTTGTSLLSLYYIDLSMQQSCFFYVCAMIHLWCDTYVAVKSCMWYMHACD